MKTSSRLTTLIAIWIYLTPASISAQVPTEGDLTQLKKEVLTGLDRAINYMSSLAIEGGYVYHYTLDGQERWGEGKTGSRTIEVQPPGTPAVGMTLLRAHQSTSKDHFLEAAKNAAFALIKGQNELGGWEHKIYFDRPTGKSVSFDDNQSQSAIRFLMALDQEIELEELSSAIDKALAMMLTAQLENGGWPHKYPREGNYHDYATFNDQVINDCVQVMIEADSFYNRPAFKESLKKVGRFIMISQLPPPQPGWAQQYNEFLQPAWARDFEPPAVCPLATIHTLNTLMDLYDYTGHSLYLKPVPDAIKWLKASRLPNGLWGRFLELGSNKPLYYDRGRIRVDSVHHLSEERRTGYRYQTDLKVSLNNTESRYLMTTTGSGSVASVSLQDQISNLIPQVNQVLKELDAEGRWITHDDKFRKGDPGYNWSGAYRVEDRISTAVFNRNVLILCEFLDLCNKATN